MRFVSAVTLALAVLWVPVDGVAQRNPLKGLTTMDQLAEVHWGDIEGESEAQYRRELETAFELGLLRTGIKLGYETSDVTSDGWLVGRVILVGSGDGTTIARSIDVSYHQGMVPSGVGLSGTATFDEHWQVATTWSSAFVGVVGRLNLPGTVDGETCAEAFELEWLRANN